MQKITFILQEDGSYKYIGKVEWREDTFEEVKDKLKELEISDIDFEKISKYNCKAIYEDAIFSIQESDEYLYRYGKMRKEKYPKIEEYIDAQVKKSSDNPAIRADGEEQERNYFEDCLAVKAMYPKPIS